MDLIYGDKISVAIVCERFDIPEATVYNLHSRFNVTRKYPKTL
jgi:hypothetical protein